MDYSLIWSKALRDDEKVLYEFSISPLYLLWMVALSTIGVVLFGMFAGNIIYGIQSTLGSNATTFSIFSGITLIVICSLLIGAILFYFGFYMRIANAYALTNSRLIVHRGWLWTNATSIEYNDITDVEVKQGLFENIFSRTGSLFINTAGTDSSEVRLFHIAHPYDVRKKIDNVRDDLKSNPQSQTV